MTAFRRTTLAVLLIASAPAVRAAAQSWPPKLPGGQQIATVTIEGVEVDFMYFPDQTYKPRGNNWTGWGDGLAVGDKYYTSIGDHVKPTGRALVYEYDSTKRKLRLLVDIQKFLKSAGVLTSRSNYSPGKIHSRLDMGSEGWLYFTGHRGSGANPAGFEGDWVFRTHPETGKTEIVLAHPVRRHVIPASVLDPERMIFYGGTAAGLGADHRGVDFFAYDIRKKTMLKSQPGGFSRYAILSRTTGRVYWKAYKGSGKRYDPATNAISDFNVPSVRSATRETSDGKVYGTSGSQSKIWTFNVKTEKWSWLGDGAVGKSTYIASINADPTGRYLYYFPGAHGGAEWDGSPVVQFDVKTAKPRVVVKLYPALQQSLGYMASGTFGTSLSPDGERLYITLTGNRNGGSPGRKRAKRDTCALAVIHLQGSRR